jgi:hypothetical protein
LVVEGAFGHWKRIDRKERFFVDGGEERVFRSHGDRSSVSVSTPFFGGRESVLLKEATEDRCPEPEGDAGGGARAEADRMSWRSIEPLLKKIRIQANPENQPVHVRFVPPPLTVVGTGTDGVVVHHPHFPRLAFKVYAEGRSQARENEYAAYRRLGRSPYFPVCYGKGDFYLVLSYEEGPTL